MYVLLGCLVIKNSSANAGDTEDVGLIPGSSRAPGGGNGNPLQYSCVENRMDRGADGLQSMGSQRVRQDLVTEQAGTDLSVLWDGTSK